MISDKSIVIGNLADQYGHTPNPDKKMKAAIQIENHANALRVLTERLATETRCIYGGNADD